MGALTTLYVLPWYESEILYNTGDGNPKILDKLRTTPIRPDKKSGFEIVSFTFKYEGADADEDEEEHEFNATTTCLDKAWPDMRRALAETSVVEEVFGALGEGQGPDGRMADLDCDFVSLHAQATGQLRDALAPLSDQYFAEACARVESWPSESDLVDNRDYVMHYLVRFRKFLDACIKKNYRDRYEDTLLILTG